MFSLSSLYIFFFSVCFVSRTIFRRKKTHKKKIKQCPPNPAEKREKKNPNPAVSFEQIRIQLEDCIQTFFLQSNEIRSFTAFLPLQMQRAPLIFQEEKVLFWLSKVYDLYEQMIRRIPSLYKIYLACGPFASQFPVYYEKSLIVDKAVEVSLNGAIGEMKNYDYFMTRFERRMQNSFELWVANSYIEIVGKLEVPHVVGMNRRLEQDFLRQVTFSTQPSLSVWMEKEKELLYWDLIPGVTKRFVDTAFDQIQVGLFRRLLFYPFLTKQLWSDQDSKFPCSLEESCEKLLPFSFTPDVPNSFCQVMKHTTPQQHTSELCWKLVSSHSHDFSSFTRGIHPSEPVFQLLYHNHRHEVTILRKDSQIQLVIENCQLFLSSYEDLGTLDNVFQLILDSTFLPLDLCDIILGYHLLLYSDLKEVPMGNEPSFVYIKNPNPDFNDFYFLHPLEV